MCGPSVSEHSVRQDDTCAAVDEFLDRVDRLVERTGRLSNRLHDQVLGSVSLEVIEWAPDTIRLSGIIRILAQLSSSLEAMRELALAGAIEVPALSWSDHRPPLKECNGDLMDEIHALESDVEEICVDLSFLANGLTHRK